MKSVNGARFQLEINGEPICITGIEGIGTMTALVEWWSHDPLKYESPEKIFVRVKGVETGTERTKQLSWHQRELKIGDVITIRVLGPGAVNQALSWHVAQQGAPGDVLAASRLGRA